MKSILIAGVGGQGTLLASMVFGQIALRMGYDVKLSEVHGMAQRGGSVVTYVRMGDQGEKVYSPVIDECGADILLAFEELEGLRWLPYLNPQGGKLYCNSQQVLPMPVIIGAAEYPQNIPGKIKTYFPDAVFVDALKLANEAGSVKAVNTVLLGVLAKNMPLDKEIWKEAIRSVVKPKFIGLNENAFELGYAL
ncbi:indolepyruvate oxidoreductase subunit beta [Christensenella tenuis]|jgi:indolepyruvate ferredoxin oxidoreductase, beta subunit|uniref:Indolepyruvate oxidoreductase subunit beta n=1 Tax=Christensenella tenuis TaxID=2763033 RepID=A0ABR7EBU5_9FIRM|nr:indolepyruvate oxidoreductase subunit beta [Christensenella tenuis]MBC5647246.1 indolepyruvate oxidoreductase subunit beta [Christensenella tenuis]